jgi:hypothetical protein
MIRASKQEKMNPKKVPSRTIIVLEGSEALSGK